jgi:hypothetical protein
MKIFFKLIKPIFIGLINIFEYISREKIKYLRQLLKKFKKHYLNT